jgi:hypothetical protein
MFVRMLDGPFAGEIKDLRNDVALEFMAQKRAENPFKDPAPAVVAAHVDISSPVEVHATDLPVGLGGFAAAVSSPKHRAHAKARR